MAQINPLILRSSELCYRGLDQCDEGRRWGAVAVLVLPVKRISRDTEESSALERQGLELSDPKEIEGLKKLFDAYEKAKAALMSVVDSHDQIERVGAPQIVARAVRTTSTRKSSGTSDASKIREWAKVKGMEVSDKGMIPANIREAYEKENR